MPKFHLATQSNQNGQATIASPTKGKPAGPTSARNAGVPVPGQKPEDKDAPETKKKAQLAKGTLNLSHDNATNYGMTESLFTNLKDVFETIIANKARTGTISPTRFHEVLRRDNEVYRSAAHQDAHEFLNMLLNQVVDTVEDNTRRLNEVKHVNGGTVEQGLVTTASATNGATSLTNTRWVHEIFEGTLTSETKCLTCENVSQRDEPFLDLSVDLEQHSSVTSCLRKFSAEEMLCERDKFFCDRCGGLQEAEKRMKIKRLPRVLALHLKRFKYTEDLQRLQKLFYTVHYPYHLRLFNTTDDVEDPDRLYELYAVVVHIGGGPYHGHYVAIIKTPERGWMLFDDENVEPVDKSFVRNFFGNKPGMSCAYLLFYQETTLDAVKREQEAEGLAAAAKAKASTTPANAKDAAGLGLTLKTNGISPHPSDSLAKTTASAISPIDNEPPFPSLNHAATAPTLSSTPLSPINSNTLGSPAAGASETPVQPSSMFAKALSPQKSDVTSKKERAKEEKERKAAEKEREKQEKEREKSEKAKRKSVEARRKELAKKETADLKAALEQSKKEEAKRMKEAKSTPTSASATTSPATAEQPPLPPLPASVQKENIPIPMSTTSHSTNGIPQRDSSPSKPPGTAGTMGTVSSSTTGGVPKPILEPSSTATPVTPSIPPSSQNPTTHESTSPDKDKGLSGPLNRFRQSSKSLRHRPKFWSGSGGSGKESPKDNGGKDGGKDSGPTKDEHAVEDDDEHANGNGNGGKWKDRFSLRRKASTLLS